MKTASVQRVFNRKYFDFYDFINRAEDSESAKKNN